MRGSGLFVSDFTNSRKFKIFNGFYKEAFWIAGVIFGDASLETSNILKFLEIWMSISTALHTALTTRDGSVGGERVRHSQAYSTVSVQCIYNDSLPRLQDRLNWT